MIFGAMAQWLGAVLGWVFTQVPGLPTPPAMLWDGVGQIGDLMALVNGFCGWVDFDLAKQAFGVVLGVWVAGFVLRVVRVLLGFFIG